MRVIFGLLLSLSLPIFSVEYKIPVLSQEELSTGISKVIEDGIFYLEIPHCCRDHLDDALAFSYQFPHDENIQKYTDGKFGGYHAREHDQIESFYIEKRDWDQVLPTGIQQLAYKMTCLSKTVLKTILAAVGIPEELWGEGTGLITEDEGQHHFSFNHYRFEKKAMGIKVHQDFGFISILFIEKEGLEVFYKGQWESVPPLKDHFVVILGRALQILVNDTSIVSGAWHRVFELSEERVSFAITCDNEESYPVRRYQRAINQLETVYESYHDYLTESFKNTYAPPNASDRNYSILKLDGWD